MILISVYLRLYVITTNIFLHRFKTDLKILHPVMAELWVKFMDDIFFYNFCQLVQCSYIVEI